MSKTFFDSSQYPSVDNPNEYFRDERNEAIQAVRNFTQRHVKKDGIGNTVSGIRSKVVIFKPVAKIDAKIHFDSIIIHFSKGTILEQPRT